VVGIGITLHSLPEIGFAHHFYAENYEATYGIRDSSFEIVYVKSGELTIQLENREIKAAPGSVFILCRQLPFCLRTVDNSPHSHCSIQLQGSFDMTLFQNTPDQSNRQPGLLLPIVMPASAEAERIGRTMHRIIASLQASRTENGQSCALATMGILADLDISFRKQLFDCQPSSVLLSARIKEYIDSRLHTDVTLAELAQALGRSANYLNAIFKQVNGIPIRQYINRRKAILIAELMVNKNVDFRTACENAAITDVAYGYRLFKKQMGTTPQKYVVSAFHDRHDDG